MPVENVACQDNPGGRQPDQTRAWSPLDMSGRFICCHGTRYTALVFLLSFYLMLANHLVFRRMFSWIAETGARKPCIKPLVLSATLMLPAAILVAPRLGEASYILLAVVGVYYFLQNSLYPKEYKPTNEGKKRVKWTHHFFTIYLWIGIATALIIFFIWFNPN